MAIPGYTPTASEGWVKDFTLDMYGYNTNQDLINSICEFLGVTSGQLADAVDSLIDRVLKSPNMPLIIRENGTVDLHRIYPKGQVPTPFEKLNVVGNIADYNMGMTWGIVDGTWTVFFGEAASLWIAQSILPIPVEIPVPKIKLIAYDYLPYIGLPDNPPPATPLYQPMFAATYLTRYGESGPSNIISCPLALIWNYATLALDETPPSMALKVYYYRNFWDNFPYSENVFRRVAEVAL